MERAFAMKRNYKAQKLTSYKKHDEKNGATIMSKMEKQLVKEPKVTDLWRIKIKKSFREVSLITKCLQKIDYKIQILNNSNLT